MITPTDLQFLKDKPVPYRPIPRATEDSSFKLQITTPGPVNYFEKFFWLTMRGDNEMIVESFDSLEQLAAGNTSIQHWYRDK